MNNNDIKIKTGQLMYCAKPTSFFDMLTNRWVISSDAMLNDSPRRGVGRSGTTYHIADDGVGYYLCLGLKNLTKVDSARAIIQRDEILAKLEYEKTGQVKGYLFLSPEGRTVWLARYDVNFILDKDPQKE